HIAAEGAVRVAKERRLTGKLLGAVAQPRQRGLDPVAVAVRKQYPRPAQFLHALRRGGAEGRIAVAAHAQERRARKFHKALRVGMNVAQVDNAVETALRVYLCRSGKPAPGAMAVGESHVSKHLPPP